MDDLSSLPPKLKLFFGNSWNSSQVLDLFDRLEGCKEEKNVFWTKVSVKIGLSRAFSTCVYKMLLRFLSYYTTLKTCVATSLKR